MSSMWCPQRSNYYGRFWVNAGFLAQNFSGEAIGTGAVAALADHGNGWREVAGERGGSCRMRFARTPNRDPAGLLSNVTAADMSAYFAWLAHADNGSHKAVDFVVLNF
jgi:hypothetical protein